MPRCTVYICAIDVILQAMNVVFCRVSCVALFLLPFNDCFAVTYYSQGSLNPAATTSWNTVRAGGGAAPTGFTSGDVFVIQSSHSMNPASIWTVSGAGAGIQ